MKVRTSARGVLVTGWVIVLLALGGCSGAVYSGPNQRVVNACVEVASGAELRQDSGVPTHVESSDIIVVQTEAGPGVDPTAYEVTGSTVVGDDGIKIYEWTCTVEVSYASMTLTAILNSFQLVSR